MHKVEIVGEILNFRGKVASADVGRQGFWG